MPYFAFVTILTNQVAYISSSSTYATHSKVLDQESLKDADVVFLTGVTEAPTFSPDATIREFCSSMGEILKHRSGYP